MLLERYGYWNDQGLVTAPKEYCYEAREWLQVDSGGMEAPAGGIFGRFFSMRYVKRSSGRLTATS